MRRRRGSIAADPMLIGAVTIFLAVVVVYFVYNADSGLPFVPTYKVTAVLPDAQNVARNAEVRMAGVRVGRVGGREVRMLPGGRTEAILDLELDKSIQPLSVGTTMRMRATSSLGGNYVEILPGQSSRPLRGANPVIHAAAKSTLPTLSDALQSYDEPTRRGVGESLSGYGNALVGRGADLNGLFHEAPATLRHLDGAARVLAAPTTRLGSFIDGLSRFNGAVAPVAEEQAGLFVGLDRTLGALAEVRGDVAQATSDGPPALEAGIDGFPSQRGLVRASSSLFAAIAPGVRAVRGAADDIEGGAVASPRALRSVRKLAPELATNGTALRRFSQDSRVVPALETLLATLRALGPTAADLKADQAVCNYIGVLARNATSAVSDGYSVGNWLTVSSVLHLPGDNSEAAPSSAPSNAPPGADGFDVNRLHANPAPYTGAGPDGPECEAGNESYTASQVVIGHPAGRQRAATVSTAPKGKK
jgi:ABC-type transporter Mla subunit MlaD